MKRYFVEQDDWESGIKVEEDPGGEWVKAEDALALESRIADLLSDLRDQEAMESKLLSRIDCMEDTISELRSQVVELEGGESSMTGGV